MISSSTLGLLARACPHALTLQEDGAPYPRDHFAAGTAAHVVLEEVTILGQGATLTDDDRSRAAARVVAELSTVGRSFRGDPQPPLPLDAALEGADLALDWLRSDDAWLPSEGAHVEGQLEVGEDWTPGGPVWYGGLIDLLYWTEGAEGEGVLVVRDYKTAWPHTGGILESAQLRGYALLALAHAERLYPDRDVDVIRREVVNLRRQETYHVDLPVDSWALGEWRDQLDAMIRAIPRRERRTPNPGPRCGGCSYVLACEHRPPEVADLEGTARRMLALRAEAGALEATLREATRDSLLSVDGSTLGYQPGSRSTPSDEAVEALSELYRVPEDESTRTLLRHLLTAGGVSKALRAALKGQPRERRAALEERCLTGAPYRTWGWRDRTPE